jgi:hypothetical protein
MALDPMKATEQKLSGRYLAPVYPEAPKFDDPEDDLAKIGIAKEQVRSPYREANSQERN